jgi:hypothetical protein
MQQGLVIGVSVVSSILQSLHWLGSFGDDELQNRYDFAEYRDVTGYSEHAQWIQQSARITFILAGKLLFIMQR